MIMVSTSSQTAGMTYGKDQLVFQTVMVDATGEDTQDLDALEW